MTVGGPQDDPASGAPQVDRDRWPVVYRPTRGWTAGWRVVAVLLGAATVYLAAGRLRLGPGVAEIPGLVLYTAGGLACAATLWRAAAWSRLRRGSVHGLNPALGPLRDEKLTARMRREILRPEPLAPELRRPAAVQVALRRAWGAGIVLALGLVVLGALLFRAGTDPGPLAVDLVVAGALSLPYWRDAAVVRAAVGAGAVPRVAPAHERTERSGRG